ncbi:probable tRNA (uracil-O(2)-)-methyltransferase [Achroia grisella]|uniref:probable tRNA (uracil-O(2)-)-methyltransferase n=1 Tax=Achroia grisella TaxID=688607 RepID=UPI0027D30157|nr:probable tRNA (uracil-O(2)-)-methyltransferase [Achroia grisella]
MTQENRTQYNSFHTFMSSSSFWDSIQIMITKPNVINKRLWGCKLIFTCHCKPIASEWKLPLKCYVFNGNEADADYYKMEVLKELGVVMCVDYENTSNKNLSMILLELLPKNYTGNHAYQIICLNKYENSVTFYNVTPIENNQNICPEFTFSLQLINSEVVLNCICDNTSKSYQWLLNTVLPQFLKWGQKSSYKSQNFCNETLALVSKDKYYKKYNELKLKYGKEMVKIWPECTDPSKFVYEDVAIATYILLLWEDAEQCNSEKPTFIDLGCGNGLLVYILTKEGYHGTGIDIRKRQIWDMYTDIQLEERTIVPSDSNLFPNTHWIIGNHSDELTPWIPVIAARSSYKCNFFLLPCCAYNFDGSKYQRQNSSKSQYTEYLEYIRGLSEECGFKINMDRLKIPSTKRICLIGTDRIYSPEDYHKHCKLIQNLINQKISAPVSEENGNKWLKDFKPREQIERVRNCTQIDKSVIDFVVNCITTYLLKEANLKNGWYPGKLVDLNELVAILPPDKLKHMKSECGGIQTLLKNNHHIFKVQNGKVQFRYPKTIEELNCTMKGKKQKPSNVRIQKRPCWFYDNHPQGCPLPDSNCSFLHSVKKEDIQNKNS